jgi:hypothetical protein
LAALTAGLTFAQVASTIGSNWKIEELTPAINELLEEYVLCAIEYVLCAIEYVLCAIEYVLCVPNPDKDGDDIRETIVGYVMIWD